MSTSPPRSRSTTRPDTTNHESRHHGATISRWSVVRVERTTCTTEGVDVAWSSSDRRSRLPHDWPKLRAQVKRRARGRCEAAVHVAECDRIGTDCDHITQGDDHSLANLQWLSRPCHDAKTRADNGIARRLTLPSEQHPGAL